ncbi:MAG: hypothetical protein AVDCRST_MAG40-3006, partial [uncultured Gemmatimonadaceae bacterium]
CGSTRTNRPCAGHASSPRSARSRGGRARQPPPAHSPWWPPGPRARTPPRSTAGTPVPRRARGPRSWWRPTCARWGPPRPPAWRRAPPRRGRRSSPRPNASWASATGGEVSRPPRASTARGSWGASSAPTASRCRARRARWPRPAPRFRPTGICSSRATWCSSPDAGRASATWPSTRARGGSSTPRRAGVGCATTTSTPRAAAGTAAAWWPRAVSSRRTRRPPGWICWRSARRTRCASRRSPP